MSDPAKTPEEIEDVLASVRRLVSDHSSTTEPVAAATPAPEAPAVLADALVLTPSFRVTDPEDPWVPVTVSEAEPEAQADVMEGAAEDLVAEIVTADAAEPTPSDAETDWQPDDRLANFDAVGDAEDGTPEVAEWEDDHSDTPSDEDMADLIRLDGSEATSADFESETGDDNWPEGGAEAALLTLVARREPAAEPEEDVAEDLTDEAQDAVSQDDGPQDDGALNDGAEDDAPLVDEEADEAADTEDEDTPVEAEEAAEDVQPIFARHAPDASAEPEPEVVEDLGDTESPFSFPETDEGILDEETLREIIVDVVREELQGVLGQRITRNVRKMVRREIRLAMAAEDLE